MKGRSKTVFICRFHQKLLELINEFSEVVGYKINIQNQLHFYTPITKRKGIKKTIPFLIASKRMKYLGINLNKDVKDLYMENYKTLKKEIEDTINGSTYHVHG